MTQTTPTPLPNLAQPRTAAWRGLLAESLGMLLVLALLVAGFSFARPAFFSRAMFLTIANQVPATVICAVGMTYVLIIAGIDLSVGSVLGLSGVVLGLLMAGEIPLPGGGEHLLRWPLLAAVPVALLVGLLCGLFNGLVTIRWALPSFIVTLGMMEVARGGAHWLSRSGTRNVGGGIEVLATLNVGGLTLPFLLAVGAVAVGQVVLSRTVFGRYMVAIGTNEEAARLSGIDPRPVKVAVFALSGLLAGVAAVLDTARLQVADPNHPPGFELQVIAAVVVGGTSLMGGRGSVVGSFFGVLVIATLGMGLAVLDARDETKRVVTGLVIILAAVLDQYRHRWRGMGKR